MRFLITGGAGFIGSHLIRQLLDTQPEAEVVNFDKLTYCGDLSRLKEVESDPRYRFIQGDVCDPAAVEKAMTGCASVIHLAAETHVDRSLFEAKTFFDTNLYGTYTMLECAKKTGVEKFLYVSTDEVYGSRLSGFFSEKDALAPTSPYAVSKAAADLLTLSYSESRGLYTIVTRGCNTFGPFQYPEKMIPLFVSNALAGEKLPLYGDGLQVRNWIHVEDHAAAILLAFKKGRAGQPYNISTSFYLTNIELTKKILKILGKPESLIQKVTDRIGHDKRYALKSARLRALGWRERMPFQESVEKTVLWYRENDSWWRAIKEKSEEFKRYYAKAYTGRT